VSSRTCANCGRICTGRRCPTCQAAYDQAQAERQPWRRQRKRRGYQRNPWRAFQRDQFTCRIVGCNHTDSTGKTLEAHHLRPLANGGTSDPSNLLTVCRQHHHRIEQHARGQLSRTAQLPGDKTAKA